MRRPFSPLNAALAQVHMQIGLTCFWFGGRCRRSGNICDILTCCQSTGIIALTRPCVREPVCGKSIRP
jgi:hypothetical protein